MSMAAGRRQVKTPLPDPREPKMRGEVGSALPGN
jgi:hypothetical protein